MGSMASFPAPRFLIHNFQTVMFTSSTSNSLICHSLLLWQNGRSLNIDPIGTLPTCSLNCCYCPFKPLKRPYFARRLFIPTDQLQRELLAFAPWSIDWITLSGCGEPTLALNLGEIIFTAQQLTGKPVSVLTNGTLLREPRVREELTIADQVVVKLDAVNESQFHEINQPILDIELNDIWVGLQQFQQIYPGHLTIQTTLRSEWSEDDQIAYIQMMRCVMPDEIQISTASLSRPSCCTLAVPTTLTTSHPSPQLNPPVPNEIQIFSDRIQSCLSIPVRYPMQSASGV